MRIGAILFFVFFMFQLMAQEKLEPLQAPTSPAAGILNIQPKAVLAPKSYQALETALYSNIVNSNSQTVFPTDFALEFTPYWTKDHGLSLTDYLYPTDLLEQWLRTSSISIASTQNFILADSTSTNALGMGYRTSFFFPGPKDRALSAAYTEAVQKNQFVIANVIASCSVFIPVNGIKDKNDFLTEYKAALFDIIQESNRFETEEAVTAAVTTIYADSSALPELDPDTPDPFIDAFAALIETKLEARDQFSALKEYIRNRQGFAVDIAFATLLNFPTNEFEFSYIPKSSFWFTPTYQFSDRLNFLKVLGVLRYEWYNDLYYERYFPENTVFQNNLDYGLSIASQFKRFALQFELVGRSSTAETQVTTDELGNALFRKESNSDLQYMGTFSYNLTDQIVLTYTLGSRFKTIIDPQNTLVSLLALNFGFGAPGTKDLISNQ